MLHDGSYVSCVTAATVTRQLRVVCHAFITYCCMAAGLSLQQLAIVTSTKLWFLGALHIFVFWLEALKHTV